MVIRTNIIKFIDKILCLLLEISMEVNIKECRKKLNSYSKSTKRMILDTLGIGKPSFQVYKIIMESETEEEVVEKINK